ncbi:MAG: hypothetical protein Q4G67_07055 [Actinomycetia bacterium]|nr:hypothetical protein [Actinomycetes bacterium]
MDRQRQVEDRIVNLPRAGLSVDQAQELLLEIADILGSRPVRLTSSTGFLWRVGDRGIAIRMGRAFKRDAYVPRLMTFDWQERDTEDHQLFDQGGVTPDEVPYVWRIPLGPGDEPWLPPRPVAQNWEEFFTLFTHLNTLPAILATIPPQWRPAVPREAFVNVSWNVDGPVVGSINVDVCPGRVGLWGYGQQDLELDISVEDIERRGFSVPAFLAGLTENGEYHELQYFATDGAVDVFPKGPGEEGEGPSPDEVVADGGRPSRVLTLAEARTLLDGPARPERQFSEGGTEPITTPVAAQGVPDLAYRILTQPDQGPRLVADAGLDVDGATFREGLQRVPLSRPQRTGVDRLLQWDPETAVAYGAELTDALARWLGVPAEVAASPGAVTRLWGAGDRAGVAVTISGSGPELMVGDRRAISLVHLR